MVKRCVEHARIVRSPVVREHVLQLSSALQAAMQALAGLFVFGSLRMSLMDRTDALTQPASG